MTESHIKNIPEGILGPEITNKAIIFDRHHVERPITLAIATSLLKSEEAIEVYSAAVERKYILTLQNKRE
ncbi:MAG: hypothetical protein A3B47_02880 [Candidatus Levybacteria bacterium RIFCSPLOWO2_01_FULL_39_24]|nr:MAG: hypothetical protein A2800_02170 [Candidatus Levybacteria bacterium RIFCSPHIGHO2_01_FULL_40_16]OGH28799.1 MAG: hypothetical protein A3E12_03840 [Candidatus Levybacteria bacterium RIFCSPHIGHO2_12_FULL_39_9]OGH46564.1 MAG: hypothetical protein A3B47_02880 [Candidatus Levybacteria bacterium RIFCSPLOWO2_01_FULL_39_24]